MLKFALERWAMARPQMEHLFLKHWEEVAVNRERVKLAVDEERYLQLDNAGLLHLVIARDEQGVVRGYWCLIVSTHLHYKNDLMASSDFYYLQPEFRGYANAKALFRFAEETLKARGVKVVAATTKLHSDKGKFLEHLGWIPTERQYTKYIG